MQYLTRLLPAVSVVALLACAGEPTRATDVLIPSVSAVQLSEAADSVLITATVNGAAYGGIRLRVREETRENALLPVVDAPSLARGVLRPAGPGTAVVEVVGGPGLVATVAVTVQVAAPTVFWAQTTDHAALGDTTYLHGVHLEGLADDAVTVGGAAVPVLERQPNRIAIPAPARTEACTASSAAFALALTGATVAPIVRVVAPGEADLTLAVGEWRELTSREAECLRVATGQEYVLAFADAGPVDAVRDAWSSPPYAQFTVSVVDRTLGGDAAARLHAALPKAATGTLQSSPLHAVPLEQAPTANWVPVGQCSDEDFTNSAFLMWCRSTPWAVGDTMRLLRPHSVERDTVRATVYAIHDFLVFAAIDGDNSANLQRLRATMDSVMPLLLQHAVPFFRETLGPQDPVTSTGSGQLLTVIGDFQHGSVGGGCCYNGAPWSGILLGSTLANDRAETLHLLAHELAHTYQRRWMFSQTPAGGSFGYVGPTWATEGGADLLAYEVMRRVAGLPWGANAEETAIGTSTGFARPMAQEAAATGNLLEGYSSTSSFLRDLVARLVDGGAPLLEAYRTVARGSLEDWFGHEPSARQRMGLSARMAQVRGAPWDPVDALLLYFLAQGADERVQSNELRNPFWKDAWRSFGGDNRNLALSLGSGGQLSAGGLLRMGGGTMRLVVPAGRSAVTLASTEPAVRWAVARTR